MSDAHDVVWEALQAEPKPISEGRALLIGIEATAAAGQRQDQFTDWFQANKAALLKKLNG